MEEEGRPWAKGKWNLNASKVKFSTNCGLYTYIKPSVNWLLSTLIESLFAFYTYWINCLRWNYTLS